ncbi:hypothetical protein D1R32_gp481 [Tunisvirus fontaine2]|uniref:Uncharacterized protein n=1 Tax=Tunisvirus fontaine2 TaxID=1421067 RepID=V9SE56_9VIRU|nr:hypothetical protein D1R32_gp481 [Tunisvirus fontaine2]AHC55198.1 hypothetical protein TNS_ORF480 [Tunisvirus fontaine2]
MRGKVTEILELNGIERELIEFRKNKDCPWLFECFIGGEETRISWKKRVEEHGSIYEVPGRFPGRDKNIVIERVKMLVECPEFKKLKKRLKRKFLLDLKKRMEELEQKVLELEYSPGSEKAREAQTHFEQLAQ